MSISPADSAPSGEEVRALLDPGDWSLLNEHAPELGASLESLHSLAEELSTFMRPMGPADALRMGAGLEMLRRLTDALTAISLSVFERNGIPSDYGAKSTRSLIRDCFGLSDREAGRRVSLAQKLGGRTTMTGQALDPEYPTLADKLTDGELSSDQVEAIVPDIESFRPQVRAEHGKQTEELLADQAPNVRVKDIHALASRIEAQIDPDGAEPVEVPERSAYFVKVRNRRDGSWDLAGRLDSITGGILNGLLASRIRTDASGADRSSTNSGADGDPDDPAESGELSAANRGTPDFLPEFAATTAEVRSVLSGDAPDCGLGDEAPLGVTVGEKIYDRFESLVHGIEADRTRAGAAFALVVTTTMAEIEEHRRTGTGIADTDAEFRVPLAEALNGSARVFGTVISEKAKTVSVVVDQRFANAKQLAVLAARDRGCSFPGCETPPGWCDAHHVVPWSEGGKTSIDDLTLACGRHHALIDKSDWHTVMLVDGRLAWVPPATVDPARRPILHARFLADDIAADIAVRNMDADERG